MLRRLLSAALAATAVALVVLQLRPPPEPVSPVVVAAHGVPAGRIFTAPDMLSDPQYLARDLVRRLTSKQGWDVPMTGVVPRFTDTPGTIRHVGPALGEDTDDVLRDVLGLGCEEIASLRSRGAVA